MPSEGPTHATPTASTWVLRSDEDVYEQRVEYAPASPSPPPQCHPSQDDHFDIDEGTMVFVVAGVK